MGASGTMNYLISFYDCEPGINRCSHNIHVIQECIHNWLFANSTSLDGAMNDPCCPTCKTPYHLESEDVRDTSREEVPSIFTPRPPFGGYFGQFPSTRSVDFGLRRIRSRDQELADELEWRLYASGLVLLLHALGLVCLVGCLSIYLVLATTVLMTGGDFDPLMMDSLEDPGAQVPHPGGLSQTH